MHPQRSARTPRTLVVAVAVAAGLVGLVGACEFMISDSLPAFTCRPDGGAKPVCPGNQICAPSPDSAEVFVCVDPCTDQTCNGRCDRDSGLCLPGSAGVDATTEGSAPADAGEDAYDGPADAGGDGAVGCQGFACKCFTAADCEGGFTCVDRTAVTSEIWSELGDAAPSGDAGVCMAPCCTSSDCDYTVADGGAIEGFVCFATGAGGNYCVPSAWPGDRTTLAINKSGGAPCNGDAGACRSGLCLDSGVCADTCCDTKSSSECATSGDYCRFGVFPGSGFDTHFAANCTTPAVIGAFAGGMGCGTNSDCRSDLCVGDASAFGVTPHCADACRNRDNCQPSSVTTRSQTCNYIQAPSGGDVVAACMPLTGPGNGDGGAGDGMPCRTTSDCARGYCAQQPGGPGAPMVCVAVCFFDTDMSSSSDCPPTERCRPQSVVVGGTTYSVLACGP